jgi:hypothetical protein
VLFIECSCCLFRGSGGCEFESGEVSVSAVLVGALYDVLNDFFAEIVEASSSDLSFTNCAGCFETFLVPDLDFSTSFACVNGRGGLNGAEGPLFMLRLVYKSAATTRFNRVFFTSAPYELSLLYIN